ncbi:hypothetical protein Holit_01979 [Hollandina sp. SP2]
MLFSPLQHQIIAYIIAENEELDEPNPLTPYMHALDGGLMPDMHFTLYLKEDSGITLYVQNTDGREPYHSGVAAIKKRLIAIADFMLYLVQQGYVKSIPKNQYGYSLPIPEQWQGYDDFTPAESETLTSACSVQLIPRFTLYDYWESTMR